MRRALLLPALLLCALSLTLAACAPNPAMHSLAPPGADNATAPRAEITHPHSDGRDSGDNSPSPSRGGGYSPSHGSGPGPHK